MATSVIKKIKLEYCKGIAEKEIELDIKPNVLNLLVAPNGFGKSSIAHTFNAINSMTGKLEPKDEDWYYRTQSKFENKETELPYFYLTDDEGEFSVNTTEDSNIINKYDIYVINSKLSSETRENHRGKSSVIESKFIIENIPFVGKKIKQTKFDELKVNAIYKKWNIKNTKVYKGYKEFLDKWQTVYDMNTMLEGEDISSEIESIIHSIDEIDPKKTAAQMLDVINSTIIQTIKNSKINILIEYCNSEGNKAEALMKVIHFFFLTQTDSYNEAIAFYRQSLEDNEIEKEINSFNTTINNVYTTYYDGGEFEFPSPEIISNGQRDILTLVTQLLMAKRFIKKNYGIIVIDEVFDYLDESNIIAAQYYILKMINEFKRANKKVYFLLLTHVDPMYYVTYRYLHGGENDTSLINVVYLDRNVMSDKCKEEIQYFKNILNARNASDTELNPKLNKYYFHFSSKSIDELDFSELFIERSLHNGWAKPKDFINYCNNEIKKYSESKEYNPFAVACFLRYMMEELYLKNYHKRKKRNSKKIHRKHYVNYGLLKIQV